MKPSSLIKKGYHAVIVISGNGYVWKIKSKHTRTFESNPMNMTIEQSIDYLSFAIPVYWNQEVQTIQQTGGQSSSGDAKFLVNGSIIYEFNLNTGQLNLQ